MIITTSTPCACSVFLSTCSYGGAPFSKHVPTGCFLISFNSGQGETVTSILIDLNGFWTYENRELLVQDVNNE